jgi:predicted transglutaminase-like cysteine proteinase
MVSTPTAACALENTGGPAAQATPVSNASLKMDIGKETLPKTDDEALAGKPRAKVIRHHTEKCGLDSPDFQGAMTSGAPSSDPALSPQLGMNDRPGTGQHDFVAMERQLERKSLADGPGLFRGFLGACSELWVGLRVMRVKALMLIVISGLLHAGSAAADNSRMRAAEQSALYMRVFGQAVPPFGFIEFCNKMPSECTPGPRSDRRFHATPERLSELDEVNRYVNRKIRPATDYELYGVNEKWTLPTDRGDCEDYALLKRKILIERGWPPSALLLTVVRDELGEGHAVLTARTAQGDFILDNKVDEVMLWYMKPYEYIMRQSFLDPRVWVSLNPQAYSPAAIAVVRNRH